MTKPTDADRELDARPLTKAHRRVYDDIEEQYATRSIDIAERLGLRLHVTQLILSDLSTTELVHRSREGLYRINAARQGDSVAKYRKKPVVIEAHQTHAPLVIETLEGVMRADPGDWIITGVKGEKYPCKPDIFEATYDKVDE